MRVVPVFIMKRAGLWLLDCVQHECRNAILSACRDRCGNNSLIQVPLCPYRCQANGDFIRPPTASWKNPVLLSNPASFVQPTGAGWGLYSSVSAGGAPPLAKIQMMDLARAGR